jgi:uncharacterized protein
VGIQREQVTTGTQSKSNDCSAGDHISPARNVQIVVSLELDFTEMADQAKQMNEQLGELLARIEEKYGEQFAESEETCSPEPIEREETNSVDRGLLEKLFDQAKKDRLKAFELKQELDRLKLFKEYEDRFLDLFLKSD